MPLWTPADLAVAPHAWHDASNTASLTLSGSLVTSIDDLSGNARGLGNTGTNRPSYSVTGFPGSLPGITATESPSTGLKSVPTDFALTSSNWAFFMSFAMTGSGDFYKRFWSGRISSVRDDYDTLGAFQVFYLGGAKFGSNNFEESGSTGAIATGAGHVLGYYGDGVGVSRTYDGTVLASVMPSPAPLDLMSLGVFQNAYTNTENLPAVLGEHLVLGYTPTTDERQRIEGYLSWKWGTVALLPSGHPYKTAAPQTGSTDITGSMSAVETGSDTLFASGTVGVSGSMQAAETGADTMGAAGSVAISGALSASESGADSFASSGTVTVAGPTGTMSAVENGQDALSAVGTVSGNVTPTPSYQAYYGGNGFSPKPKKGEIEKLERLLFPKKRKPKPVVVKAVVTALKEAAPDVYPSILLDIVSNVVEVAPLNESKVESRIATEAMFLRVLELQEEEDIEALLLMS